MAALNDTTKKSDIVAGLDIGTTKVCIVIMRPTQSEKQKEYEIIGVSSVPSTGLRKGVVVNIDATVESIVKAREEAELMAGVKIDNVWAGVAGSHIQSFNSRGMVAVKNREISQDDINRVLDASQAVAIPEDRQILHILPQNFVVDSQDGIRDPRGMSGVRLESNVHIVTGLKLSLHNIQKCAEKAGLKVNGLILESLASAEACLSQDEKDLGVAVVDMGGGTCDIIVYSQGSVVHTAVLPIGGSHLTHDISVGLRTPAVSAEEVKRKFGCAMTSLIENSELIEVPSVGGRNPRTLSRSSLTEVIEPRIEETLHLINNEVVKSGYQHHIGSGIVLTGGASMLEGVVEFGEFIFETPVRRGVALETSGLKDAVRSPQFATAVGVARYGALNSSESSQSRSGNVIEKIRSKVTELLDGVF